MKKFFIKFTLLTMVLGLVVLAVPKDAFARSVAISPLVFEMTAKKGEVLENNVKVFNPSEDTTVQVKMQVEDIKPTGNKGHVTVEPANTLSYSLAQWVTMEPRELTLEPKEEKYVKFTIKVPEVADPGGHYGTILATTKQARGPKESGVTIKARTGALALVTVPGEMEKEMKVADFSAPAYSEKGPIPFEMTFKNSGTVHLKPKAKVTVTNWLGQKVGEAKIEPENVLPTGRRKFQTKLSKKWLWAGLYNATLTGSYGENINFGPHRINFWAFPWKVGVGILVILFLLFLVRKRLKMAVKILFRGE